MACTCPLFGVEKCPFLGGGCKCTIDIARSFGGIATKYLAVVCRLSTSYSESLLLARGWTVGGSVFAVLIAHQVSINTLQLKATTCVHVFPSWLLCVCNSLLSQFYRTKTYY